MTDASDEFIMNGSAHPRGSTADGFPKSLKRGGHFRRCALIVGEEAGGVLKEGWGGSGEAITLGAGHRVAADEVERAVVE